MKRFKLSPYEIDLIPVVEVREYINFYNEEANSNNGQQDALTALMNEE